jgi:hypothetical protein
MKFRLFGNGIGRCRCISPDSLTKLIILRSAGLEEYIEGLSFLHYLEHGSLISLKEVQETLSEKETGQNVSSSSDFLHTLMM